MGFAAPLFGLLVLAAGYVWYLHSRREYRQIVPSLVIWQQLRNDAGFKRKARLIPPITPALILQLLAIALLAAALALPFWGNDDVPEHLVVVVDTSAPSGTLAERAAQLSGALDSLVSDYTGRGGPSPHSLTVIAGGPVPHYRAARWAWEDESVPLSLADLYPTDGQTDWLAIDRLIDQTLLADERSEVVTLGASIQLSGLADKWPGLKQSQREIGAAGIGPTLTGNLTLVDAEKNSWSLEAEISGTPTETIGLNVHYATAADRTPLDWAKRDIKIGATGLTKLTMPLEFPGSGIVTVSLGTESARSRLHFLANAEKQHLAIFHDGAGDQVLLKALNAVSGTEIFRGDSSDFDTSTYGLVVTEGAADPSFGTNVISIEAEGAPLEDPDPDFWVTTHPLSRNIDWSSLSISQASGLTPNAGDEILLSAGGVALITAATTEQGRHVRLGFDPAASNWPDLYAFPVFVANLIDWMGIAPDALAPANCLVGRPCQIDSRLIGETVTSLTDKDAPTKTVENSVFVPSRTGLFQIGSGERTQLIAVNQIIDRTAPQGDSDAVSAAPGQMPYGLAPWLVGIALVVLAVEAVITARRRGKLPQISWLRVATLALLLAATLNLPLPWVRAANSLAIIAPVEGVAPETTRGPAIGAETTITAELAGVEGAGPQRIAHLDASLALAQAMIPPNHNGHIVLASDGKRHAELERQTAHAAARIHHLPLLAPGADEVFVERLDLPSLVLPGEPLLLTALVHSAAARTVEIELLVDGEIIASQPQALETGSNRIETTLPGREAVEALVELRIVHEDAYPQNNVAGRYLSPSPARPLAIIAADPAHGEAFARLLADQGLESQLFAPGKLPFQAEQWLGFGGIVLLNTPALALTTAQQTMFERLVAEHGMGLVLLGGPNAFGPGGYFGTPLEALSPLSSRVPQDAPEVAMVFVLDRSGSMQQTVGNANRLDVAKMATVSATELLNPQSRVGIIVFDAEARTVLPMTRLADAPGAVGAALTGFDPGGGTDILPGLKEAVELLRDIDAPAKHVVVMTDGLSQPTDYTEVVGELRAIGATVSAVAIGQGADSAAARIIAELGGGSAHVSTDFAALPSILSQEAMLLSSPVEEGLTQPIWTRRPANYLSALPLSLPGLSGFVGTTAKDEAELFITAQDSKERDMPILAAWRYGNGQVLALATDATGLWSEGWQRLPQYGALWKDVFAQFQPITPRPGETLSLESDGDALIVSVSALDDDGLAVTGANMSATMTGPDGRSTPISLAEIMPGHYEGRAPLGPIGRYEVTLDGNEEEDAPRMAVHHHSYSAIYDFSRSGAAQALAAATGGSALSAERVAALAGERSFGWLRNWPVWCLIGFALLLVELTFRYRGFPSRRPASARAGTPNGLRPEGSLQ